MCCNNRAMSEKLHDKKRQPHVTVAPRFRGPVASANGGYFAGEVAKHLGGARNRWVEVTLRAPPPLVQAMRVSQTEAGVEVHHDGALVAQARLNEIQLDVPAPVSIAEAEAATRAFGWASIHPYPECFVCGTERSGGDGMCLYPGPVDGRPLAAAPWVPDPSQGDADGLVDTSIVWAALDCPSWFGALVVDDTLPLPLTGRIAARILQPVAVGQPYAAVGWLRQRDGRKIHTAAAIFDADGALVGEAASTWILLKSDS